MLRGVAVSVGGLIVLQVFTTAKGAGAVGGLLGGVNTLLQHAFDPSLPLIPDHSTGGSLPAKTPTVGPDGQKTGGYINGNGQYIPPSDSTQKQPNPIKVTPESYIPWPAVPGTTTA